MSIACFTTPPGYNGNLKLNNKHINFASMNKMESASLIEVFAVTSFAFLGSCR